MKAVEGSFSSERCQRAWKSLDGERSFDLVPRTERVGKGGGVISFEVSDTGHQSQSLVPIFPVLYTLSPEDRI